MTDSDTPRTTSGMELLHRMSWNVKSAALWRECILAIEAEAAQPAPLDALNQVEQRIYHGRHLDLSEARYYMDEDVEAAFDSERRRLAAEAKP